MAIALKNSGQIGPHNVNTPFVGHRITASIYFRVNARPANGDYRLFGRGNGFQIRTVGANSTTTFGVAAAGTTATGQGGVATKMGAKVGTVYHAIFVYDKDDPDRRFIAVNSAKAPFISAGSGGITSLTSISYGVGSHDVTIQRAFFLDGYAATDDDIFALADDVDAAPTVFAAGLARSGVTGFYHSMAGVIGEDVHRNDPGLSYGGNPAFTTAEPLRPLGTEQVKYAEEMVCRSEIAVERAYIGSSGRSLTMVMGAWDGSGRVSPASSGLASPISLRVDGGSPIILPTTSLEGVYAEPTAEAIYIPLPVEVAPSSVVTLDAPQNWFVPNLGYLPQLANLPVTNASGRPVSEIIWPDAPPTRVGINTSTLSASVSSTTVIHKNRALSFGHQIGVDSWPDGTLKGNVTAGLCNSGMTNGIDLVGMAGREGRYVVRWDDHDPAKPVTITLSGTGPTDCVELTQYRNNGDVNGCGKVRVYEVRFSPWRTITLRSAIDATTTSIPYSLADAGHTNTAGGVAVIDGEHIRLTAGDAANRQYINCIRGWNGTTAAPHAANSPISISLIAKYGGITISITSSDAATTRYKNLAVYDPASWVEPEEVGPIVVPPPDNLALDPTFESQWGPGAGAFRPMSTSQGSHNCDIDEPELLAREGDGRYGSERYAERFNIRSIRPFDPAVSPYYYAHAPVPNSETYTATLGAPITTAPPSGTIEKITIAEGRATPVIYGQVLWAGGEKMRVVKMPISGDLYEVERGSEGTPTSTHAPGPITIGYRIPITSGLQYNVPDNPPLHFVEALFDEALSSPPRFGRYLGSSFSILGTGWIGDDDVNIDARQTLTLTAPLAPTATTLSVAATDWSKVATNLKIALGGETMTVVSANSTAGTVTVASRSGTAPSQATGAMATTKSGGVLVRSADGLSSGYAALLNGKSCMFPTGPGRAMVTTADPTAGVVTRATAAAVQRYESVRACTRTVKSPAGFHSYEFMANAAAKMAGAWCWVNIPLRASDATVYAIAKATLANYPSGPGRKVIVELCNESWNFGFYNYAVEVVQAAACGVAEGMMDFHVLRSQGVFDVFKRVFEVAGRGDDLVHCIAWQTGSNPLSACRRRGVDPDAFAVAPYLMPPKTAAVGAVWSAVDNGQYCDFFTFQTYYELTGVYRYVASSQLRVIAEHKAATGKDVMPVYYEGGMEYPIITGTPGDADTGHTRRRDVIDDPASYFTEVDLYAAAGQIGKVELFCQFDLSGGGRMQVVGGVPQTHFWGLFRGPAQLPGYGDGRPGDVDNRLRSFVNPTDLTRGPDVENRSVRGQAMLDHQAAFIAAQPENPTDPEEPGPVDPGPITPPRPIHIGAALKLPISRFGFRIR